MTGREVTMAAQYCHKLYKYLMALHSHMPQELIIRGIFCFSRLYVFFTGVLRKFFNVFDCGEDKRDGGTDEGGGWKVGKRDDEWLSD